MTNKRFPCFTIEDNNVYTNLKCKGKLAPRRVCHSCQIKRYPCFTPEQWVDYCVMANESHVQATICCHDCLPAFHEAMKKAGKCRFPTVYFVEHDGALMGKKYGRPEYDDDEAEEMQLDLGLF